jgi:hypothetical protein
MGDDARHPWRGRSITSFTGLNSEFDQPHEQDDERGAGTASPQQRQHEDSDSHGNGDRAADVVNHHGNDAGAAATGDHGIGGGN